MRRYFGSLARVFPTVDAALFEDVRPHTGPSGYARSKVRCVVCGSTGYPGGPWMESHRRGHAPCPLCGRPLTRLLNGHPRKHSRCPARRGFPGVVTP